MIAFLNARYHDPVIPHGLVKVGDDESVNAILAYFDNDGLVTSEEPVSCFDQFAQFFGPLFQ